MGEIQRHKLSGVPALLLVSGTIMARVVAVDTTVVVRFTAADESLPRYEHSNSIDDYSERVPRPQTSNAMYSTHIPPADYGCYARPSQVQPSNVMKAMSTGVATKKYIHLEKENIKTHARVNPSLPGALYAKKKSLNSAVPS